MTETLDRYIVPADMTGPFLLIFGVPGGQPPKSNGFGSGHDLTLTPASQVLLSSLDVTEKAWLSAVEMVLPKGGTVRLPYRTVEAHTPYVARLIRSGELFVPLAEGVTAWFSTTILLIDCEACPEERRHLPIANEEALRAQAAVEISRRVAAGMIQLDSLEVR